MFPAKTRAAIAHRRPDDDDDHLLSDHLTITSTLAGRFAWRWGGEAAAALAGRWHDLGKFSADFQDRIARDRDGHLEGQGRRVNHSHAGARLAQTRLGPSGPLAALAIAGHHAGLPDWNPVETPGLKAWLDKDGDRLLGDALASGEAAGLLDAPPLPDVPEAVDAGLWGRMLASALVDADFLDSEAFFDPERSRKRGGWAPVAALLSRFEAGLARRLEQAPPSPVDPLRAEVLAACRAAARRPPGLFSLTVPTGGGKTLASLAFALDHLRATGFERVIYAVPFTSIIEQTAEVFREVLDDRTGDAVLEHHSALDPGQDSARARLAAENWDAPVIVTTTVQLFESLFANRSSAIRKLHNLAGSVLVLDEVQALPPGVLAPVTAVLDQLVRHFAVTVVLCTATQPALGAVFRGFSPVEIMPDPSRLFRRLDRVAVEIRPRQDWETIAADIAAERQVLAIVNTRADCRCLHRRLPDGTIHLSTWQCAADRRRLLADIRRRLERDEPVRVVSTSLIEAGVDVDFPVVFRAMAGLDALAQAAGRCNRNGRLAAGRFVVVRPEGSTVRGGQSQAIAAADPALAAAAGRPFDPAALDAYFHDLFWAQGDEARDVYDMIRLLRLPRPDGRRRKGDRFSLCYRTAAERFRMIDEAARSPLLVPCDDDSRALIARLRRDGPDRALLRRLQSYVVPVSPSQAAALAETVHGLAVLADPARYRADIGLEVEPLKESP